jgi:hypothetical protein
MGVALTVLLPQMSTAPIGANSKPMAKSVGRTLLGVKMGCQALRRCCLNAVSTVYRFRISIHVSASNPIKDL